MAASTASRGGEPSAVDDYVPAHALLAKMQRAAAIFSAKPSFGHSPIAVRVLQ